MANFSAVVGRSLDAVRRIVHAVGRSTSALLAALVCLSVLTSVLVVGSLAVNADRNADTLIASSIAGAVDRERSRISNEAYINSHWNDAVVHAYGSMSDPWVSSQWGTPIGRSYVIDAQGHTLFAHLPEGHEPPLKRLIGAPALRALLERVPPTEAAVRKRASANVILGIVQGQPALIAFSPIVRETGAPILNRSSYRIFVDIRLLNHSLLEEWARGFGLRRLWWEAGPPTSSEVATTEVRGWSGKRVGVIAWSRLKPGTAAVRELTPIFLTFTGLFLAIAALIARRVQRLNKQLAEHTLTAAEAARQEQEARLLADSDGLTGLYNRRRFYADLRLAAVTSNIGRVTVGLIDLDRFKPVNDTFGHHMGDQLLIEIAKRLRKTAGDDATLYRIGGDEFAMIMSLGADHASQLADKLCLAVAAPVRVGDRQVSVGASIGLGAYADLSLQPQEVAERADQALYQAKRERTGRAILFNCELERSVKRDHRIEVELQSASFESELRFEIQPIVSAATGGIVGGELLARWTSARLGIINPQQFVEVAERSAQIHKLTRNAVRSALKLLEELPGKQILSVNVSACDLQRAETVDELLSLVRRSSVDPARLCIEVTETAVMRNLDAAVNALGRFRAIGMEVALDDFGTGYSSLSNLHRLPLDKVKIDRSFALDLHNQCSASIVNAVIGLCKSLGLSCIAEGVETAEQGAALRAAGCDLMQGYYFGRPADPADFTRLLVQRRSAERDTLALRRAQR
ncbi:putative bifunctional diguanylate cyclase/phosphodiesterase [Sphingomonas sp.]|uniref:putative bifunctional diguanylate cyclase/phosphodiesterase n=1 Tax=Sphingomonas sp. TaxID=28214 RepID=UPI002FDAEB34